MARRAARVVSRSRGVAEFPVAQLGIVEHISLSYGNVGVILGLCEPYGLVS